MSDPARDDRSETAETAELAVRRYLAYLEDPASVLDTDRIAQLEQELAAAGDPIRRLHLHAAIEKARRTDGESVRAAFVAHARDYAASNDLPVSAFRAMGVSDIALAEAGFDLGYGSTRAAARPTAKPARAPKAPAPRQRAPKVSQSTIRDHVLSVTGSFTLNDLMGDVGGSLGTVNAVVKELIADGKVESLGPDADHHGRGRAPIRYRAL